MAKRIQKIYWDLDDQRLVDSSGYPLRDKSLYPYIYLKEKPTIEVHFISEEQGDSSSQYNVLTSTMWFSICVDDDYDHDDSSSVGPLCKVTDANINQSQVENGILSFTLNGNTSTLLNTLGTSNELTNTYLEIKGYNASMDLEFVASMPFHCRNVMCISDGTNTPSEISGTNFEWYVNGSGLQCLRILNDDGQILTDLTP